MSQLNQYLRVCRVHSALFALPENLPGLPLFLARVILQISSHLFPAFEILIISSHLSHGQRQRVFGTETQQQNTATVGCDGFASRPAAHRPWSQKQQAPSQT